MIRHPSLLALCLMVACGGSTANDATPAPPAGQGPPVGTTTPPRCDAATARDITVVRDDLGGYPPYAVAECSLAYVSTTGALVLRDLATGAEVALAAAEEKPRRPAIGVDDGGVLLVAWEATLPATVVRVRHRDRTTTIAGDFTLAGEPRVSGHLVSFTGWKGPTDRDESDVWLYDAAAETARVVLAGAGQQRFSDVAPGWVAASDFSEDPDGRYDANPTDLADIALFEIATGKVTRRAIPGKQAFPMLSSSGVLAYLSWSAVHPEPKLQAYEIRSGAAIGDPAADKSIAVVSYLSADPVRPALAGDTIEWVQNPTGTTVLYRASVDGSSAPQAVPGLDGLVVFAPAPSRSLRGAPGFTLVAVLSSTKLDHAPRLEAIAR